MKKLYIHLLMISAILVIPLLFTPALDSHTTDSPITMSAYAEDGDIASGTILIQYNGNNSYIPWRITSDKTLLIGKDGETYRGILGDSYSSSFEYPWIEYKEDIKSVKIYGSIYASGSLEKMFYGLSSMTDIDLGGLDTKEVHSMNGMFSGCSSLKTINISSLDTGNVWDMDQMFFGCKALQSIDLSGSDTKNVITMKRTFSGCSSLKTLDLSNCNGIAYSKDMIKGCKRLKSMKLGDGIIRIVLPVNMIYNNKVYYKAGATFYSTDYHYYKDIRYGVHSFKASKKLDLKKISISRIKGSDRSFTVKWKKASKSEQKKFSGYQVEYDQDYSKSGAKTVTAKKSRYHQYYTGMKLKKNTTYYVRIRRFKKSGGKTIYAPWSNVKVVKTK